MTNQPVVTKVKRKFCACVHVGEKSMRMFNRNNTNTIVALVSKLSLHSNRETRPYMVPVHFYFHRYRSAEVLENNEEVRPRSC